MTITRAANRTDVPPFSFEQAGDLVARLEREVSRVIIGQRGVVREVLTCMLAGGHCLLRGVPGLSKTLPIKTLAEAMVLVFLVMLLFLQNLRATLIPTLVIPVAHTIFFEMGPERRASMGIAESLIRVSVGIEDTEDLLEDFRQALAA